MKYFAGNTDRNKEINDEVDQILADKPIEVDEDQNDDNSFITPEIKEEPGDGTDHIEEFEDPIR